MRERRKQPRVGLERFAISPQPNDTTCGPTCLHAVYRYHGDELALDAVIREVPALSGGGTLAVLLANHALARGYAARIYTYNLALFDPTWFTKPGVDLAERLRTQASHKADAKLQVETRAYLEFIARGGELGFEDLRPGLIRSWLTRGHPILTGLSATYLYQSPRERGELRAIPDDVRGTAQGHFVVLVAYDAKTRAVRVADPLEHNPPFHARTYWVPIERVIGAILLGVLTYDANLTVLTPAPRSAA